MTAKEAISQLQERIDLINKDYFDLQLDKYAEALEVAIEALNQFADPDKKVSSSCGQENDLISRQALCEYALNQKDKSVTPNDIMRFPSAQPKRTDKRMETNACDLISRAMLLEYIHNEPVGKMLCDKYNLDGVIKQLPPALPDPDKLHLQREQAYMQGWEDARLIDRQAALRRLEAYRDEDIIDIEEVISSIGHLPAVQPEIIRCKDCKHYQFADNRAFGMPVKMCEWFGFEDVDDDDFCSRAERREK